MCELGQISNSSLQFGSFKISQKHFPHSINFVARNTIVVFVTEPCFPNTFDLKSIKNRMHSILLHLKLLS